MNEDKALKASATGKYFVLLYINQFSVFLMENSDTEKEINKVKNQQNHVRIDRELRI